ncbi:MAG: hypothetical protein EP343_21910 [Deltaproteobacteria bacterium]|nr:MAG: hypothetical protein EP343_21910 [Deltaproteobacteria bacterium]
MLACSSLPVPTWGLDSAVHTVSVLKEVLRELLHYLAPPDIGTENFHLAIGRENAFFHRLCRVPSLQFLSLHRYIWM